MKPIILLNFASRSRPDKFLAAVENIELKIGSKANYQILAKLDNDDASMQFMRNHSINNLTVAWGDSKSKIHAINRDIPKFSWNILVNMSDDMYFTQLGFDETIREAFENPKGSTRIYDLDQCIHFPDGNTTEIITMSILGRKYFDRFGYVYHPEYTSLWCDNEQTDVAKMLGKYKFVDKNIFEHRHPAFGKGAMDAQYKHTESYFYIDKDVYDKRKQFNFI